jgi:hypothetical protein
LSTVFTAGIVVVVQKMMAPATQDTLLKRTLKHPMAPELSRRHRRLLKKFVCTQGAVEAMFDQDEIARACLADMIADSVFREPPSPKSFPLAGILIAEIPACLTAAGCARGVLHDRGYRWRRTGPARSGGGGTGVVGVLL